MIPTSLLCIALVLTVSTSDAAHIGRVIGGSPAPEHAYPYQVSLQLKLPNGDRGFHFCSGSILNERWILTAGHCADSMNAEEIFVLAGTNHLDGDGDVYDVDFLVIYEPYTSFYYDDIALIRVTKDIEFSAYVSPVALPEEDIEEDNVPAIFSGWGSTKLWGPSPNDLQEIELKIVSNTRCIKHHSGVTPGHICSFSRNGEGICHGDSGGPLVARGCQVGIASYVTPCAVGHPDVYTRVYKYVDWIRETQEKYN